MTFEKFFRQPYKERQLVVFRRDALEPSKTPLSKLINDALWNINRYPLLTSLASAPFGGIAHLLLPVALTELFSQLSKIDKGITYIPYKSIGMFNLPKGEVREGVIYVGHPIETEFLAYFPMEEFHQSLHRQKSHELVRILSAMNLKHFTIKHLQGYKDLTGYSGDLGGKKGGTKFSAGGEYSKRSSADFDILWDVTTKVTDEPPRLPDDLVWYEFEPDWQIAMQIVKEDRLQKMNFHYSYRQDFGVDLKLKIAVNSLKASAQNKHQKFQSTLWDVTIER